MRTIGFTARNYERAFIVAIVLGCTTRIGSAGAADKAPPPSASAPPLSESLQGSAREAYEAGRLLFEQGDFAGATVKFRLAYAQSRDPRLLWNLAVCEKNQRHYARMQTLLRQYLVEAADSITPEREAEVLAALQASATFVGALRIQVSPEGTSVEVDDTPVGLTPLPQPVLVDLGIRRVRLAKPGFRSIERRVEVHGGDTVDLDEVLEHQVRTASLTVLAPAAADIQIDGRPVGRGSWVGELPGGPHRLAVTSQDHKPFVGYLDLQPGSARTMQVSLDPTDHTRWWPWAVGGVLTAGAIAAIVAVALYQPHTTTPAPEAGTLTPNTVYLPLPISR